MSLRDIIQIGNIYFNDIKSLTGLKKIYNKLRFNCHGGTLYRLKYHTKLIVSPVGTK